mmetsp:Transcript_125814/g.355747  ORF Transcript_125814/g.355747 Transcript_125814/m.355747 type:complete len:296 (+) Transcript_125814:390-1277(+)
MRRAIAAAPSNDQVFPSPSLNCFHISVSTVSTTLLALAATALGALEAAKARLCQMVPSSWWDSLPNLASAAVATERSAATNHRSRAPRCLRSPSASPHRTAAAIATAWTKGDRIFCLCSAPAAPPATLRRKMNPSAFSGGVGGGRESRRMPRKGMTSRCWSNACIAAFSPRRYAPTSPGGPAQRLPRAWSFLTAQCSRESAPPSSRSSSQPCRHEESAPSSLSSYRRSTSGNRFLPLRWSSCTPSIQARCPMPDRTTLLSLASKAAFSSAGIAMGLPVAPVHGPAATKATKNLEA